MTIETTAFIVGIILGTLTIGSAAYVWIRNQNFGMGGSVLSVVGLALVGLSIWSTVKIEVSAEGLQAEFKRLESQLNTVAQANQEVTQEVKNVADTAQRSKEQFVELTRVLEERGTLDSEKKTEILKPVLEAPPIDVKRLNMAAEKLKRVTDVRAVRPRQ